MIMRKVIMYCDRCKKEFEKWNHKQEENIGIGEIVHDDGNPYLDCQKDLCESCYTELVNWWSYKPKSEWQQDHEILKAYSDGANEVLDKIRAEIMDFEEELFHRPNTDYTDYAAVRHCVEIIDEYKAESEE